MSERTLDRLRCENFWSTSLCSRPSRSLNFRVEWRGMVRKHGSPGQLRVWSGLLDALRCCSVHEMAYKAALRVRRWAVVSCGEAVLVA